MNMHFKQWDSYGRIWYVVCITDEWDRTFRHVGVWTKSFVCPYCNEEIPPIGDLNYRRNGSSCVNIRVRSGQ